MHREETLSKWFPTVDAEVKRKLSRGSASAAFNLTGHQIDKTCEAAMEGRNLKHATPISQLGGYLEFRTDILAQLRIWREQRVHAHLTQTYARSTHCLAVLSTYSWALTALG